MILINGHGPLAEAIEQRLREMGAVVELFQQVDKRIRLPQGIFEHAAVLVLAADDDAGNVDLALQVRQMQPSLPLVVRLFDSTLAAYLTETIPGVTILSMSKVVAPVFAKAAGDILDSGDHSIARRPRARRRQRQGYSVDRVLMGALLGLFLLVFPSALIFSHALNLRYMDALYFVWTTVMTVGYGDIALKDAGDGIKLFGMALMLGGASFIAVLFALFSDWVLSRRLDMLHGRVRVLGKGHTIIVGAGNIGFRIAELLGAAGRRLVIIESDPDCRNLSDLRNAGHHTIIADATLQDVLELAGLDRTALVLAVTDTDAVNLRIALHARESGVPVAMRLNSVELAAHVSQRGDGIAISPIVAAAESFALAAISATSAGSAPALTAMSAAE